MAANDFNFPGFLSSFSSRRSSAPSERKRRKVISAVAMSNVRSRMWERTDGRDDEPSVCIEGVGAFPRKKKSTHENSMDRPIVSSGETLRQECRALNLMDPTMWHKVAAISGLAAIGLGAYGTHGFRPHNAAYKEVWQTASLFHLVHTAALVGAPITKHPNIFGALLTAGILAFSGTCYTAAYLEDRKYSFLAPFGGFAFIAAWASLLF